MDEFHKQKTIPGNIEDTPLSTPLQIPEEIGPYKIDSLLEKGGMSILYLATHPETKEPVVVKVLEPKYLSRQDIVQRFIHESKMIALPEHPNIVKLYGHGEWEGGLYIAMEYIQGISLRQYLMRTPISIKRALEIVIDISYALCHLHTHGIIHRDLKPENVIITKEGQIKVIDFGIAQLLTEQPDPKAPAKQLIIGTPIYMSPEQRENPDTVAYPSDIYSLGIMTYELVLGKLCFGQIHLGLMPKGIKQILHKTLQLDPAARYQDIVDYIADITAYLESANFTEEAAGRGRLNELYEGMKRAQAVICGEKPPQWDELQIDIYTRNEGEISLPFYDFHTFDDQNYGIILGKCIDNQPEALFFTAVLHGMIRALFKSGPPNQEFITSLNQLLTQDDIKHNFSLVLLFIDKTKREFRFTSCGNCPLWIVHHAEQDKLEKIALDNPLLGADEASAYKEIALEWNPENTLALALSDDPDEMEGIIKKKPKEGQPFTVITVRPMGTIANKPQPEQEDQPA